MCMKKKKPEYKSGWEQHWAEQREGLKIEKEEGQTTTPNQEA